MTTISPGKLIGLTRLADENGRFKMLAVDQRPPIENLVKAATNVGGAPFADVAAIKASLIANLAPSASAVLLDPQYIFPTAIPLIPRDSGIVLTLEDDTFDETDEGRLSSLIPDWSVDKIQASGGDAVKLLAWYRPDASGEVREHQRRLVASVGAECARRDIPFVFELLLYPFPGENTHTSEYVESPAKKSEHVYESVETFSAEEFGVDVFKLESPLPVSSLATLDESVVATAFRELNRVAGRPWVVLSAGADQKSFTTILGHALKAGASGYLAGRAIWWDAAKSFPDLDLLNGRLSDESVPYMAQLNGLTDSIGLAWHEHERFLPDGPHAPSAGEEFRRRYMVEK